MNRLLRHCIFGIAVSVASTATASVTFFETSNFGGRQFKVERSVADFGGMGFSDRAQSAIVEDSAWELCGDQNFGGGCTTLEPGRYPSLGGLSGRVNSARPLGPGPVAGVLPGGITFYESENFGGRQIASDRSLPNFRAVDFNDRARSLIIEGGAWEVCVDANFGGGCTILRAGRYPTLGEWSKTISSARPASSTVAALPMPAAAPRANGGIIFFEADNFRGRRFMIDQPDPNFGASHAVERYQSAIVEGGPWELCADSDFRGGCRVFAPGRYADLGDFAGRLSSARPSYARRGDMPRDEMRDRASATLYSGPDLTGRAFALGGKGSSNLEGKFNDRASSLRVDRGYWIFCSDADFGGECRTFGPGEYRELAPELDHRISSGRMISPYYPYAGNPNWR